MPTVQRTVTINRPIAEVFAFFADVGNDPKWRGHGVKEISLEGEMRQGAHVHQKIAAGPFGAAVKADMDVVAYQPDRALGFQVTTGPLASPRRLHLRASRHRHHGQLLDHSAPDRDQEGVHGHNG
jgi:uncharacterized protein YndB with AHSA1/START domain